MLRGLEYNYRNSIYFDFYEPGIKADFNSAVNYTYLMPFVLYIQKRLFRFMDIQIDYQLSSALPEYTSNPHLLVRRLGTDVLFQFSPMSFCIIDKLKSS